MAMLSSGDMTLTLRGALARKGGRHDLVITVELTDGAWATEALALATTFNSPLHDVWLATTPTHDGVRIDLTAQIKPDPWVIAGGPFAADVTLTRTGDTWAGTYSGTFNDSSVEGTADATVTPRWEPVVTLSPGVPRILQEFIDRGPGRLADFSTAGYRHGETPPVVAGPVFRVEDYGARPHSGEDSTEAVQRAIEAAGTAGGGVVLFPPGRFDFSLDRKRPCLEIAHGGVVLRGAGSGADGTTLMVHRRSDSPNPQQMWRANEFPGLIHAGHTTAALMGGYGAQPTARLTGLSDGTRHGRTVALDDPTAVRVGDTYLLQQREDAAGSLGLALVAPSTRLGGNYLGEGKVLVTQLVTVLALDGDVATLDLPLHWDTRPEWRPALHAVPILREIGIEDLHLQGAWSGFYEHHRNAEHDDGWNHIRWDGVEHGWVRNVTHTSTTAAMALMGCKNCTVMDGRIGGNMGHSGYINLGTGTHNLFLRLHAGRQMHAFSMQNAPCGTVFCDCTADEPAGLDLHGGIGLDTLYDCLHGCVNAGGGAPSAVPPRHSHGLVLWNWEQGRYNPYKEWRTVPSITSWVETPGFIAVGVRGQDGHRVCYKSPDGVAWDNVDAPWGVVESINQEVGPRSLWAWMRARKRA